MLSLKELPLDLKQLITTFITRPTDLKSLCLVSKEMREIATPFLYRNLRLWVGGQEDLRLIAMLNPQNPGLQHVRHVVLRLEKRMKPKAKSESDSESGDESEPVEESVVAGFAQLAVRMLLEYLPRNILEKFTWQPWEPISVDNFCLLCRRQKKLQYVELGTFDKDLNHLFEKEPSLYQGFTELKRLDLYPDCVDTLKASQKFIEAYPNLKSLRFVNGFGYTGKASPEGLNNTSTQPGLITRTVFSHMLPFDKISSPLNLKTLVLDDIDLRYSADTLAKLIKVTNLKKLEVTLCSGVEALFAQLSKPHLRPQRLRTLRWMDESRSESHAMEAFEGLLDGISNLQNLNIWLSNMESLPKIESITRHRDLKILGVHCQNTSQYETHIYDEASLNRLCSECHELRQLSIMFPEMYTTESKFSAEVQIYLDIVGKLKKLITLNIRRWPAPRDYLQGSLRDAQQSLRNYEHDLQRLSQTIFESSDANAVDNGHGLGDRSKLSIIAWGPPGQTDRDVNDNFELMQIPFVRGTVIDPFGKSSLYAFKTNWRLASFVEPESTILQIARSNLLDPVEGLIPRKTD